MQTKREKLVQMARGYYMLPIISFLGREGHLDRWLDGSMDPALILKRH